MCSLEPNCHCLFKKKNVHSDTFSEFSALVHFIHYRDYFSESTFQPIPFLHPWAPRAWRGSLFYHTPTQRGGIYRVPGTFVGESRRSVCTACAHCVRIVCALCVCMHITCQWPSTCTIKYSTKPPCQRGITCTILSQWPSTCTKKSHQIKSQCYWGITCII